MTIEIEGPAIEPALIIGDDILTYEGNLLEDEVLVLDTIKQTAKIGNNNATDKYNGVFPLLYLGETDVVAENNTIIKWREKIHLRK